MQIGGHSAGNFLKNYDLASNVIHFDAESFKIGSSWIFPQKIECRFLQIGWGKDVGRNVVAGLLKGDWLLGIC